jgi:hypothetical protein
MVDPDQSYVMGKRKTTRKKTGKTRRSQSRTDKAGRRAGEDREVTP